VHQVRGSTGGRTDARTIPTAARPTALPFAEAPGCCTDRSTSALFVLEAGKLAEVSPAVMCVRSMARTL